MIRHIPLTLVLLAASFVACSSTSAQILQGTPEEVADVGVDEHLNALLPLDEEYVDEVGRKLPLSEYFRGNKPVLISFNYSDCPKLCDAQLSGLVRTLSNMSLKPGTDFEYISMSIDPDERPSRARQSRNLYVERYGDLDTKDGWHFLTGSQDSIDRITEAAGFRYTFLPSRNEFAHAPLFVVCTPDGRISRYLYGIEIEPQLMRLSLVEAADGEIGEPMDQIILWCFDYDPDSNSYVPQAMQLMKIAGAATVLLIAAICVPFWFSRSRGRAEDVKSVDTHHEESTSESGESESDPIPDSNSTPETPT